MRSIYKRILLKLSGESLMGSDKYGINSSVLNSYALQIRDAVESGAQVAIVIGGGNIFRGLSGAAKGFDRVNGDQMGMLATVINSLALESALKGARVKVKLMTAISMSPIGEIFSKSKAIDALEAGSVVIVAAGTGNPFFTTDTASALRAIELEADVMFKGTRVDGIYTADPEKFADAVKFDEITFEEVMQRELKVMDITAFALCKENKLPLVVFNMDIEGNLMKVITGENIGTVVKHS
ncbi:MAG: UMP kinase [Rikenellaceae bacterium]